MNISILEGKKRVILANVIDPMWNVFGCLDAGCLDVFRSVKNATQD